MKMNNKQLLYIIRAIWITVGLVTALILMNRDFNQPEVVEEKDMRLNIALVNEDIGVQKDSVEYNLGADYVKKIEKDVTYNWFTVSRGVAENGLKTGTYNLLITIPSNFSSKLLDLEDTSPEKVAVNYKINANGNATLENESKSAGRKIVNELNQQLVDLYIVSIIDNLFTAQKNIEKVHNNQTDSVNNFESILYQPTISFKQYLPSITSQSESALRANDMLTETLNSFVENPSDLVNGHQDFTSLLEELLKQREQGQLTYEDFVSILMTLDSEVVSSETKRLFAELSKLNDSMQKEFTLNETEETGVYTQQMIDLTAQLEASKATIEEQQAKLDEMKEDYFQQYEDEFFRYFRKYDSDTERSIKMGDVLKQVSEIEDLDTTINTVPRFNQKYFDNLQSKINQLPFDLNSFDETQEGARSWLELLTSPIENTTPEETEQLINTIDQSIINISEKINTINENMVTSPESAIQPLEWTGPDLSRYQSIYNGLQKAYNEVVKQREKALAPQEFAVSNVLGKGSVYVVFNELPSGVEAICNYRGEPYALGETHRFYAGNKIYYRFASDYVEGSTVGLISYYASKQPEMEETTLVTVQPDLSIFSNKNYQDAKKNYNEYVQVLFDSYQQVEVDLDVFAEYPVVLFGNLLELDATEMFKQVLNTTFLTGHYKTETDNLQNLQRQAQDIERQSEQMNRRLEGIQESTVELNQNVQTHLNQIASWQEQLETIKTSESEVATTNKETDSELIVIDSTLKTLYKQSEMVKTASEQNVKEAENVKSIFDSFGKEVETAQKTGEDLSVNADKILSDFNEELAKNNDFVAAFTKVLDNAHTDGVPNNTLMQFIANPVTGKVEATIQSTEVNDPFTWILIVFTISLFVAYLFATKPVVQKVKDTFERDSLWVKDNIVETILLSGISIFIGIVMSLLSINELHVVKEAQIVWSMVMILFIWMFTLLNHYLVKQFHLFGFATSLFCLISYVFATNAIGKSQGDNQLVQIINTINPLSVGETNLSTVLANDPLNLTNLAIYLVILLVLTLFNLLIWKGNWWRKEETAS